MNVTTKTGDKGVSYWHNRGVAKDDILIETLGELDEVQAVIEFIDIDFNDVKEDLWGIMGELATGRKYEKLEERLDKMEHTIDRLEEKLLKLKGFVIFSKDISRKINWVRTVVRRAERRLVTLSKKESVNPKIMAYVNRLSDYLFMLSREAEEFVK